MAGSGTQFGNRTTGKVTQQLISRAHALIPVPVEAANSATPLRG